MTPRELLRAVRQRAWLLFLAGKGEVTFESAERQAAREIVAEHKARPRTAAVTRHAAGAADGITVKNARQVLLAQLRTLGERLRNPIARPPAPTTNTPPTLPHTADPIVPTTPAPVAPPDQPLVAIGVFVGSNSGSTAELIDDAEFEPRWQCQSRATDNWRHSIEVNARISQRNGRWIG
jgi:hypothetical protein